MWCTVDIVEAINPKFVIWENVKNLLSKKHIHNFNNYLEIMNQLGYNSYYQVLNAKDYGIPQNRERVYTVSIRKDIDNNNFKFPNKEELKIRLKDILEEAVEEKYYLNDKQVKQIETSSYIQNQRRIQKKEYCDTLRARDWKDSKCVQVGKIDIKEHDCIKRVYSTEGISPALTNMQGGNRQPKIEVIGNYSPSGHDASRVVDSNGLAPSIKENHGTVTAIVEDKILIKNATKQGYLEATEGDSINLSYPNSNTRRGRVGNQVSQTLQCNESMGVVTQEMRIRKLTPKEYWRLMGFDDEDFEKAKTTGNSNTQLYKQAGNSIVVKVLEEVFINLLKEDLKDE